MGLSALGTVAWSAAPAHLSGPKLADHGACSSSNVNGSIRVDMGASQGKRDGGPRNPADDRRGEGAADQAIGVGQLEAIERPARAR